MGNRIPKVMVMFVLELLVLTVKSLSPDVIFLYIRFATITFHYNYYPKLLKYQRDSTTPTCKSLATNATTMQ